MSKFLWKVNRTLVEITKIWSTPKRRLNKEEILEIVKFYLPEYEVNLNAPLSCINFRRKTINLDYYGRNIHVLMHEVGHGVMSHTKGSFNNKLDRYRALNFYRFEQGRIEYKVPRNIIVGAEKEAYDFVKNGNHKLKLMDKISMAAAYNTYKYGLK